MSIEKFNLNSGESEIGFCQCCAATVVSLEDEEGKGRIRVKILDGKFNSIEVMAYNLGPSSVQYHWLPDVKDRVLVVKLPSGEYVVLGVIPSKEEGENSQLVKNSDDKENNIKKIKTKNGIEITVDDTSDKQLVVIKVGEDREFSISCEDKTMTLKNKENKLTMDEDNIKFEAKGDIELKANNIKLIADSSCLIDGGGGKIKLDQSGNSLKGTMVKIESDANVDIKAGAILNASGTATKIN